MVAACHMARLEWLESCAWALASSIIVSLASLHSRYLSCGFVLIALLITAALTTHRSVVEKDREVSRVKVNNGNGEIRLRTILVGCCGPVTGPRLAWLGRSTPRGCAAKLFVSSHSKTRLRSTYILLRACYMDIDKLYMSSTPPQWRHQDSRTQQATTNATFWTL